jgi:hypothetical protein
MVKAWRLFLLYHVAHAVIDGVSARHPSDEGDLLIDEQAGDEVFLLGCWSTVIGKDRIRLPVAWKTALAMAALSAGSGGRREDERV